MNYQNRTRGFKNRCTNIYYSAYVLPRSKIVFVLRHKCRYEVYISYIQLFSLSRGHEISVSVAPFSLFISVSFLFISISALYECRKSPLKE